jgi:Leucine-rich repeat (LRR) protein
VTKETLSIAKLPSALSRLERLESLVLSGHKIASDGVSARIFDGRTLPKLTRLDFGDASPASRVLDLSGSGAYLERFPPYVFQFMTTLESLTLSGSNISCFPPRAVLSRLGRLRALNLSGSRISYAPPSVLFRDKSLALDLSGTPVSLSLSWRGHGLGSAATVYGDAEGQFDWRRLARVLPGLTKLDISNNALEDAGTWLDLNALRHLRHLNVSHNPRLTPVRPAAFSWWKSLSQHPTMEYRASFVGLANVGLGPDHVRLW